MQMLCIRGRTHEVHTGLYAGRVYEVSIVKPCCCDRAFAEGSVFKRPLKLRCKYCGARVTFSYVPWDPNRFIPFDPSKTLEKMARTATKRKPTPARVRGNERIREKEKASQEETFQSSCF